MQTPTYLIERELIDQGFQAIVGVDEAGCGALAGPLVAAAVVLPINSRLKLLRDSKLLSSRQRDQLYDLIIDKAAAWAAGSVSVEEIYQLGLRPANYLAMRRAIDQIPSVDFVLVDAWTLPGLPYPQRGIIRGDRLVKSIAAASIIAKVTRDRLMKNLAVEYPEYHFGVHKGYGTLLHRQAIKEHGPCPIHRLNYKTFR
ncbi:ribonuclease HII [Patescibacteria group bacterium]|nr:ribonuclease HII [Patescibacteria group bacterium]MBU1705482.1 ribonuclease HII [Patescibacteria group bacterium]